MKILIISAIVALSAMTAFAKPGDQSEISSANIEGIVTVENQRGCTVSVEINYYDPTTGHHQTARMDPTEYHRFKVMQAKSPTNVKLTVTETRNGNKVTIKKTRKS